MNVWVREVHGPNGSAPCGPWVLGLVLLSLLTAFGGASVGPEPVVIIMPSVLYVAGCCEQHFRSIFFRTILKNLKNGMLLNDLNGMMSQLFTLIIIYFDRIETTQPGRDGEEITEPLSASVKSGSTGWGSGRFSRIFWPAIGQCLFCIGNSTHGWSWICLGGVFCLCGGWSSWDHCGALHLGALPAPGQQSLLVPWGRFSWSTSDHDLRVWPGCRGYGDSGRHHRWTHLLFTGDFDEGMAPPLWTHQTHQAPAQKEGTPLQCPAGSGGRRKCCYVLPVSQCSLVGWRSVAGGPDAGLFLRT